MSKLTRRKLKEWQRHYFKCLVSTRPYREGEIINELLFFKYSALESVYRGYRNELRKFVKNSFPVLYKLMRADRDFWEHVCENGTMGVNKAALIGRHAKSFASFFRKRDRAEAYLDLVNLERAVGLAIVNGIAPRVSGDFKICFGEAGTFDYRHLHLVKFKTDLIGLYPKIEKISEVKKTRPEICAIYLGADLKPKYSPVSVAKSRARLKEKLS